MGIVTKQGDSGKTKLFSGEEVSKSDLRLEISGTLDELISELGFARSLVEEEAFSNDLRDLQVDLFRIGAEFSTKSPEKHSWVEVTNARHVLWIEKKINDIESTIELPRSFVIPGATQASAFIDIARATARRLERLTTGLFEKKEHDNLNGLIYLNRLSDYLFLLARAVEQKLGVAFDAK